MEPVFRVGHDQRKGRHLLALSPISPGDIICFELAIARTLTAENLIRRCDYCWKLLERPMRCSSCRWAHFCSSNCHSSAWPRHKIECRVIRKAFQKHGVKPTPSLIVLFRTLLCSADPLSDMVSNWDFVPDLRRAEYAQMAVLLNEMLSAVEHAHSLESLTMLFARYHSNSFTVVDGELQEVGIGIYPFPIHLFNHSCMANAAVVFDLESSRAIVRATKPINADEEITIAYCDVVKPKLPRRSFLLKQYYFICNCKLCALPEDEKFTASVVKLQDQFLERLDGRDYDGAEQALSKIQAPLAYHSSPIQLGLHYLKLGKIRLFLEHRDARELLKHGLEILENILLEYDPVVIEARQLLMS